MSKREPFKVGERVRVYSAAGVAESGTIERVTNEECIEVQVGDQRLYCHPKQCRRLRKKQREPEKRLERWVNVYEGVADGAISAHLSPEIAKANATCVSGHKRTAHLVELRPGERVISLSDLNAACNSAGGYYKKGDPVGCPAGFENLARALGFDQEGGGK